MLFCCNSRPDIQVKAKNVTPDCPFNYSNRLKREFSCLLACIDFPDFGVVGVAFHFSTFKIVVRWTAVLYTRNSTSHSVAPTPLIGWIH
jgi:hypothetical protein